jgi:hypothetical protein
VRSEWVEAELVRPDRGDGGQAKGKSGGKEPARGETKGNSSDAGQIEKKVLGKRRREIAEGKREAAEAVLERLDASNVSTKAGEDEHSGDGNECEGLAGQKVTTGEAGEAPGANDTVPVPKARVVSDERGAVQLQEKGSGAEAATDVEAKEKVLKVPPQGGQRLSWLVSGGRTPARRRRQRRAEDALAVAKRILTAEFREQQLERAKVLRVLMRHVITDLEEDRSAACSRGRWPPCVPPRDRSRRQDLPKSHQRYQWRPKRRRCSPRRSRRRNGSAGCKRTSKAFLGAWRKLARWLTCVPPSEQP